MQTPRFSFHRPLLALSFGFALASLPVVAFAQDPSPADAAPATSAPTSTTATKEGNAESSKLSASDKATLRKLANGNEAEVELAKLALTSADKQEVKDFAQKMIDDHGKANEKLMEIATAHGVSDKPQLPQNEKATYQKMRQLKGAAFDKAYINHAVTDHEMDVKEYEKAKKTVKDEKLTAYLDETLPIIEGHLKMVKEMLGMKDEKSEKAESKKAKKE